MIVALFPSCSRTVAADGVLTSRQSRTAGPAEGHPLGFTNQGCDVFSRIVHGTRTSLSVGLLVTLIVAIIGILVGAFAGFFGGWLDSLLMRVGDIFFAIPLHPRGRGHHVDVPRRTGTSSVISLAIGLFAWPSTARILRSEVLRVK